MLPTPAILRWSSRSALIGAVLPFASARRCSAVKRSSNGSSPSRAAKNSSSASPPSSSSPVPKRRGSTIASLRRVVAPSAPARPAPARCARARAPAPDPGPPAPRPSCAGAAPDARRRRSSTPGTCRACPAARTRLPVSASSSSRGASGRDQRGSRISIRVSLRSLHQRRQLAPDRLHLRQLRHRALAYERTSPGRPSASRRPATAAPSRPRPPAGRRGASRPRPAPRRRRALASISAGDRQQRRVLARVVRARVRRVDAMVGRHDQQVPARACSLEHAPDARVDLLAARARSRARPCGDRTPGRSRSGSRTPGRSAALLEQPRPTLSSACALVAPACAALMPTPANRSSILPTACTSTPASCSSCR